MLKRRLIATLIVKNMRIVQSIRFSKYLPVGRIDISVEALNRWGIDEILILDIDATPERRSPAFEILSLAAAKAFVPIAFGGGLQNVETMHEAIHFGADKIIINSEAVKNPALIEQAARILGKQCVVVSVDVKMNSRGDYEIAIEGGRKLTGLKPRDWIVEAERLGAGEIFLNSIDQDGTKFGYDLKLFQTVHRTVKIPVIGCGGAGHPEHFLQAFKHTEFSALAAGNYFHFTEHSPLITKSYLQRHHVNIRVDTQATYSGAEFDSLGRIQMWPAQYLKELRYQVIKEEVI